MPVHVVALVGDGLTIAAGHCAARRFWCWGDLQAGLNDIESPPRWRSWRCGAQGAHVSYAYPFTPQLTLGSAKLSAVEASPEAIAEADCGLILTNPKLQLCHDRRSRDVGGGHTECAESTPTAGSSIVTL